MKTNNLLLCFLMIMFMMFSACMDIEVTTILNADGSLERIIEVRSDSELKDYKGLPFPVDSTWEIVYSVDSINSGKPHVYSFKKIYKNAVEINKGYNNLPNNMSNFKRQVNVEKKFRWFYTYLTFEEKYQKIADGYYKPFETYLSDIEKEVRNIENPDTIAQILEIDTSSVKKFKKDVDNKFDKWFNDNFTNEIILVIAQDMKNCNVKNIDIETLRSKRESIYKLADSIGGNKQYDNFYKSLNKLFNTNEFDKVIESKNSGLYKLEESIQNIFSLEGFKYKLQMPGLLINTNAQGIKGNQLDWEFVPIEAYFVDITHYAESRLVNVWAFVVSGIFIILVVVLLFIRGFYRK